MSAATAILERRSAAAAPLAIRQVGERWQVASASTPGRWYWVRGGPTTPIAEWRCECTGSGGERYLCRHKLRMAAEWGVDPLAPVETTSDLLLAGDPAAVMGAAAGSAGEGDDTGGETIPPKADGELMTFRCSVPPIMSAVKVDGGPDGGVRLQIDVPGADEAAALAFVKACRGRELRLVVVDESKSA